MTDHRPLLIYAPVPVYRTDAGLFGERQAINGLRLWSDNFDAVTVIMPEEVADPPTGWIAWPEDDPGLARVRLVTLPSAWRPDKFLRALPDGRRILRAEIDKAHYVAFAIGGLFGDWGAVGAIEAHRRKRPFAVWTDRIESEVTRRTANQGPLKRRIQARLYWRPMAWLEAWVIRRAALGLFHGDETFETYAPLNDNPHVVHDIHLKKADHISPEDLARKKAEVLEGPLRIVYLGRADAMKGPLDWIEALDKARAHGVDFQATWIGDGAERAAMQAAVEARGLSGQVSLPGFSDDRQANFEALRAAHLFLFCHRTPESPRCLIEALVSGTPLVGYDGAYARGLTKAHDSGRFHPIGDTDGLARTLAALDADRAALAALFDSAAADGAPFEDEHVFRHRSDLIKHYL